MPSTATFRVHRTCLVQAAARVPNRSLSPQQVLRHHRRHRESGKSINLQFLTPPTPSSHTRENKRKRKKKKEKEEESRSAYKDVRAAQVSVGDGWLEVVKVLHGARNVVHHT